MSKTIKKNLPMGQIRTLIENGVNEQDRTVELIFTTGSKGLRSGWDGPYYEELSMDPKHIDMTRLQSGAPLLAAHNSDSLDAVIGVVERAWVEGNEGKAIVRFSSDPEADKIFRKVQEKVLRNVSIGYQVRKYEDVSKKGDSVPTYRAVDYSVHEISIVPIGFDKQAQIRSNEIINEVEIQLQETEITTNPEVLDNRHLTNINGDIKMSDTPVKPQLSPEDIDKAKKQAAQEEKQRQSEIRLAVRNAKLDDSFAEKLCNEDITPDQASSRILKELASKQPAPVQNTVTVEVGTEDSTKKRDAVENALLHRAMPDQFKLTDAGREMRGLDLVGMARIVTGNYYGSDSEIVNRAMSSSDFPIILSNIAEKSVQKSYENAPSTYEKWVNQRTLRNYKVNHQIKVGDFPSLEERSENGEFTEAAFSEGEETVQLKKYGKVISMTEEMMVNDSLEVFADFLKKAGGTAKRLESNLVYDRLQAATTMNDGLVLFESTAHKNLGTSGAISETTMDELNQLMKAQKGLDSVDFLDLEPAYLLAGPQNETAAKKFLSTIIANQTSNVNPFANSVQLIIDSRITSKNWFLAADKSRIDSIVLYRLAGREAPVVSTRNKWENGNFQIKVEHAAAAQAMEHRGIAKNPYT